MQLHSEDTPAKKRRTKRIRRHVFVFTPEEKKAGACIIAALLLGLATSHYRALHPRLPPPPTARQQFVAKQESRALAARAHSTRARTASNSTAAPDDDADE